MNYDIGIIGAGISGVFAALRLAERHRHLKVVVFEFGPPPPNCLRQDPIHVKRRRRQLEGWLGCFPTGDGKIYLEDDLAKISGFIDGRKLRGIKEWFTSELGEIAALKETKSKLPAPGIQKAITDNGFDLKMHSYEQWSPDQIHQLAKTSADRIEAAGNVFLSFDTEVFSFTKTGRKFSVITSQGDFNCKRIILSVGRSGWRWVNSVFKSFDILQENKDAKYGVKVEMPSSALRDFHKAHCSLTKEGLEIGPLHWQGSVIQEDHDDMTIAAFRSNEERWRTDKVFFSVHRIIPIEQDACFHVDRIAKLSHLLSGDRVGREKIKNFTKGMGDLAMMPEYSWVGGTLQELEPVFPNIISRGYFHVPDIDTNTSKINVTSNLETEIDGLFVAGECAGIKGIAAAGLLGAVAAEGAAK